MLLTYLNTLVTMHILEDFRLYKEVRGVNQNKIIDRKNMNESLLHFG